MSNFETTTEVLFDEVDEEYMVTIPEAILEELDWREGDVLEWEYHDYNGLPRLIR